MSVQIHHAGGGSSGGGSSPVSVATLTLDNDEIKAANTPYILVAATESLGYSGLPTKLFVPIQAFVMLNTAGGAYANIDPEPRYIIGWGSDWSMNVIATFMGSLAGTSTANIYRFTDTGYRTNPEVTPAETVLHDHQLSNLVVSDLIGNLEDNALIFVLGNGAGDLTDGHADNSLTVTVLYYEVDL